MRLGVTLSKAIGMTFCRVLFTGFNQGQEQRNHSGHQHTISKDGHNFAGKVDSNYQE